MKVPAGFDVGVCSHTGSVRGNNEDDYFVGTAPDGVFLCAIADGMGGVAGGAEASRTALWALGMAVLDGSTKLPHEERVREGFAAASVRLFDAANAVPALRDMGTTLTALCFGDGMARLGHVGDTRAYRLRGGVCEQLTTDHAVREPSNMLLRCIGGGHATCDVDQAEWRTEPGDRFLLVTDGVWSVVPGPLLQRLAERSKPQAVAEALVAQALAAGGPDNATAVVVDVLEASDLSANREVDLPRDERPSDRDRWPKPVSLRPPVWPWVLLTVALLWLVHAVLRWAFGIDGSGWLLDWLRGR
ncbi:MAG TPA: PP2C family serine/threonine-protein phosphatase [Planctomycetota bacterium]